MADFNRFVRLKGAGSSGFEQIGKVAEYKAGDYQLIGSGLCTAMSLGWLADGTLPTTNEEFGELKELQTYYEGVLADTESDDVATGVLATKFGLQVISGWPATNTAGSEEVSIDEAIAYWGGVGTFGEAMSKYLNGELTETLPSSPFLIGVYLDVLEYNCETQTTEKRLMNALKEFTGGHAVALKRIGRADGDDYEFFDANAGVYHIEGDALQVFFDNVYACYCNFYAAEMKRRRKSGASYLVQDIQMSLRLWMIHSVKPL